MDEAMGHYKLYVFDADGTMRRCTVPGQPCPNGPGEWELMPGVKETLGRINWAEHKLGILSNQGGVALGHLTEDMALQLLCDMVTEATGCWPQLGTLMICPHAPTDGCVCRKPNPANLLALMRGWNEGPSTTLYVGDLDSDLECARRAGVDFMWAADFFGFEWTADDRCVRRAFDPSRVVRAVAE